uniref:TAZ-type domain-containing protein n=1 Tax=Caenorhabditis tropicalis TaxID=1561998 RepID=A0A1I7UDU4_9PELO
MSKGPTTPTELPEDKENMSPTHSIHIVESGEEPVTTSPQEKVTKEKKDSAKLATPKTAPAKNSEQQRASSPPSQRSSPAMSPLQVPTDNGLEDKLESILNEVKNNGYKVEQFMRRVEELITAIPLQASSKSKCVFCVRNTHSSEDCRTYNDFDARCKRADELQLCRLCLNPTNTTNQVAPTHPTCGMQIQCNRCTTKTTEGALRNHNPAFCPSHKPQQQPVKRHNEQRGFQRGRRGNNQKSAQNTQRQDYSQMSGPGVQQHPQRNMMGGAFNQSY